MHDTEFIIKVGDLLRNPGRVDSLSFDHLMIKDLANLTSDGISLKFRIQGVNDGSVTMIIDSLSCTLGDVSDLSGESYEGKVLVEDYDIVFSTSVGVDVFDHDKVYDDVFPLDNTHDMINVYEPLLQLIQLQTPLIRLKPGEEKIWDEFDAGDDYDDTI